MFYKPTSVIKFGFNSKTDFIPTDMNLPCLKQKCLSICNQGQSGVNIQVNTFRCIRGQNNLDTGF